ncbi:S-layer homology domain-containing protein [Flintibacter sp. KGMB00164]|uniref:S-layer homology domain-containing protein n=1 Tax=Flintibacter sp. KGMB00164 TaxID=2610895 RepID=UPI001246A7CB|nr:S-layer homology domain-containing protein [Flintibacter sp. KGMB00164]
MRNLKRALSLLLSSTMVLGMLVMGGSAAGYKDVDASNDHQEAIEVLQAVGVMSGVDNEGNFDPDGSVTRNQMAVIMAHLLNLDYDYYRGTNPFTDVPEWAAPYVAACAAEGVIAGIGNGQFGGEMKVTAAQASLMIMKALGYFQNAEDFGSDWQVATIRQASYINLFDKIDSNAESALTRGQVAQLVLNGLTSDMVYFTGDKGIQIGDVTVGYRAEYTQKTGTASKYNTLVNGKTDISEQGQYYIQLGEELYEGKLAVDRDVDDFGRPTNDWTYNKEDIGSYVNKDLMVAEYTEAFEYGDLYSDIGATAAKSYDLFTYVDGKVGSVDQDKITKNNDTDVPDSDLGALTQVFVDVEAEEVYVATINTWLAKAITDYNETTGKATVEVYTGRNSDGTTASVTKRLSDEDFEIVKDMAEGDFFTVTMAKDVVKTVAEPEVVSEATISEYSSKPDDGQSYKDAVNGRLTKVIAAGTTYKTAAQAWFDAEYLYDYAEKQLDGFTYDLLLDQYGNLLGIKNVTSDEDTLFVVGYEDGSSYLAETVDKALVIFPDGTMKTVDAMEKKGTAKISKGDGDFRVNAWYDYTVNADGVYVLSGLTDRQIADAYSTSGKIDKENTTIAATGAINNTDGVGYIFGNADSTYISVTADDSVDPARSIVEVNGITTGIKNTSIEPETGLQYDSAAFDGATGYYNVFALYNKSGYVTYAVVIGEDGSIADKLVYLTSGITSKYYDSTIKEYVYKYDAIINGEPTEIKSLTPFETDGTTDLVKDTLYKASYDADGFVTDMEKHESNVMDNTADYKAEGYSVNSYAVNSDATLTLKGATLYLQEGNNTNYAILDENCRFYVNGKDDKDGKYNEYGNASAMLAALGTDNKVDGAGKIVVIADKNTGYATSIIILDAKYTEAAVNPSSNYEFWKGGTQTQVTSLTGVQIQNGTISFTDSLKLVNTVSSSTVAANRVKVTYEVATWDTVNNKWNASQTVESATTATVAAGTDINTVCSASLPMADGVSCKVTVTVSCNELTYTFPTVVVAAQVI